MQPDNKNKFTPVSAEVVMIKVQQALIDTPNAKWLEITGFRRCKVSESVHFERGIPALIDPPYVYGNSKDKPSPDPSYNKWIITKLYVPATSNINVIDLDKRDPLVVMPFSHYYALPAGTNVCTVQLPADTYLEVIVKDITNKELVVRTKNHILTHLKSIYKLFPYSSETDFRVGLTNKNWKFLKADVNVNGMIKIVNGEPISKYVYSSAFKKHIVK